MEFLTRVRGAHNVTFCPYGSAPRQLLQALKRNQISALLIDFGVTHHFDITTVSVAFFGAETKFPAAPAQLALLTGAAIVVGNARVSPSGHIDVQLTPPLVVKPTGDRQSDLQTTMQDIARRLESFIRLDPEQWYVYRPMWKMSEKRELQIQKASLSTRT
jgi:phosphatidylinositol dimannoside acyltransferase